MPKPKAAPKKEEKSPAKNQAEETDKIIEIAEEDEDAIDDELIPGEVEEEELEDEEVGIDEEEVNPFGDKWEE
jgi:hypothetical protein